MKHYVLMGALLVSCTTTVATPQPQPDPPDLSRLYYLIASERYMRETDDCRLRAEICRARAEFTYNNPAKCTEREEHCVLEVLKRWVALKERMGW